VIPDRLQWATLAAPPGRQVDVNHHILDGRHASHDHDFVEIVVVVAGRGLHRTLYDRRRLNRGDAFAIRPGAWHAFEDCDRLDVVNCCFQARLLDRELLWLAEEPRLRFLLWPGAGADDGVVHVKLPPTSLDASTRVLHHLADPPAENPHPNQVAHLLLLLLRLADSLDQSQLSDAARLMGAPAAVMEALRMMHNDVGHPWTVEQLAADVAMSPSHLARLFRRIVGRPPIAHLSILRAEAAATILLSTADPVSTVGAAVGWGDPNYFARRFRAHFGLSPSAYRRRALHSPSAVCQSRARD
jgi:AraC family L-rhamnose operon transcriptional activator RhaR